MGQFHQSVESQLGQGTVDAMLQYAGTLDAGTQSTLERMVMSGDPAQMQRAVQYLQERMAAVLHYRLRSKQAHTACRAICRNVTCGVYRGV
jgi:hypothetical protein